MPKITPFLWFEDNAEDAVRFWMKALLGMKKIDVDALKKASGAKRAA